jgi:hypothetical protein
MKLILTLCILFTIYTFVSSTQTTEFKFQVPLNTQGPALDAPSAVLQQVNINGTSYNCSIILGGFPKSIMLLVSFFFGEIGLDRFISWYIGEGVAKLLITMLSCGCCGWIWWIVSEIKF